MRSWPLGRAPDASLESWPSRAAGLSPSTVSNAFNRRDGHRLRRRPHRPERLTPALRERVLRVAAELGYGGPDAAARILRRGRAGAIAVILGRPIADALGDPATTQSSPACPTPRTRNSSDSCSCPKCRTATPPRALPCAMRRPTG